MISDVCKKDEFIIGNNDEYSDDGEYWNDELLLVVIMFLKQMWFDLVDSIMNVGGGAVFGWAMFCCW